MTAEQTEAAPVRAAYIAGKAEHLLPGIVSDSAGSIITDPPYGLSEISAKQVTAALTAWLAGDRMHVPDGKGFMGQDWDRFVPPPGIWDECYRALRPGGYLLAFAAPRTADLMGLSIRLAGFEVQDSLHWIYGTGFPKAKSRLKPAHEPILMCRKPAKTSPPLPGLDGCMVATTENLNGGAYAKDGSERYDGAENWRFKREGGAGEYEQPAGRYPPNLLLTHCADCQPAGTRRVRNRSGSISPDVPSLPVDAVYGARERVGWQAHGDADGMETMAAWDCAPGCPVAEIDAQSGTSTSRIGKPRKSAAPGQGYGMTHTGAEYADAGGASRFFPAFSWDPEHDLPFLYQAKAPKSERPRVEGMSGHPTVKPLALMRWLARLVTPPDGLLLDPFAGTGTTLQAALAEGFRSIGFDSWPLAVAHARVRLAGLEGVAFG